MTHVSPDAMDRSGILDMMGTLKLFGMRSAFDEIVTTATKRQHEPQRLVGDLLKAEIDEKHARSIKYQTTAAIEYARRNGLDVVAVRLDDGMSGLVTDRPGLEHVLDDATSGRISVVIVEGVARISRRDDVHRRRCGSPRSEDRFEGRAQAPRPRQR